MKYVTLASLLLLASCEQPTETVDSMPEIWGQTPLEDLDPDPNVVEVNLVADQAKVTLADGTTTQVWAYNGMVPGPLIQARQGDTVRVNFTNRLGTKTTVHWHGLRIANEMDGVPAVQDPVKNNETFTYEFVVNDPGSYWYHPHVRTYEQVELGLQGVLVVHEADAPVPAKDRYFVLDDIAVDEDMDIYAPTTGGMAGMHGNYGNMFLFNGSAETLTDTVRPAAPERWRVLNTANARTLWVSVANATWRVIAVDGTLLPEPYGGDTVILPVGRRVDLEVVPHDDAESVKLMVHQPGVDGWTKTPAFRGSVSGETGDGHWLDWNAPALPEVKTATQQVDMVFAGRNTPTGGLEWTINDATWEDDQDILVSRDTPTEIRLENVDGQEHPFHLHGDFFQVLEVNGEPADDPGLMDTVLLGGGQELLLYTEFENPGRWMTHCHILEHAELGMMTEIVVE